ncbi:MAG: GumC family protein [Acidimicrobiales bacterium]
MWSETKRYWRIPAVAVLGGLLAFIFSYGVARQYEATATVLMRVTDNSLKSTTGQLPITEPLEAQASISFGMTYSALVESRTVAREIVLELGLDQVEEEEGLLTTIFNGIKRGRAYITHGYYNEPEPLEAAIQKTHRSISASMHELSYVMRIRAKADDPYLARDMANLAVLKMMEANTERFAFGSQSTIDTLEGRVVEARARLAQAQNDLAATNDELGISGVQGEVTTESQRTSIETQLQTAQTTLASTQAQLAATEAELATMEKNAITEQVVSNGRSQSVVRSTSQDPAYTSLVVQKNTLASSLAGTEASIAELQRLLGEEAGAIADNDEAKLALQQVDVTGATAELTSLEAQLSQARTASATARADLTLEDAAGVPTYPIKPQRWLYGLVGVFVGLLAGAALTWIIDRRDEDDLIEAAVAGDAVSANLGDYKVPYSAPSVESETAGGSGAGGTTNISKALNDLGRRPSGAGGGDPGVDPGTGLVSSGPDGGLDPESDDPR